MWNELFEYLRYYSCLSECCNLSLSHYFISIYHRIENSSLDCPMLLLRKILRWIDFEWEGYHSVLLFLSRYFLCNSCKLPRSIRFHFIPKYFWRHEIYISLMLMPRSIWFQVILKYFCRQNIIFLFSFFQISIFPLQQLQHTKNNPISSHSEIFWNIIFLFRHASVSATYPCNLQAYRL